LDTVLEWFDQCYALIRKDITSRKTFFDGLRALTRYMVFDSWQKLMEFMLEGLDIGYVIVKSCFFKYAIFQLLSGSMKYGSNHAISSIEKR